MLSLLATLLVSAPLMAAPSASVTCADGPASCDAAWVFMGAPDADRDEPRDYATPAEVECPTPATGEDELGECAYEGPLDLWYRMSRFAEPESRRRGHRSRAPVGDQDLRFFLRRAARREPAHGARRAPDGAVRGARAGSGRRHTRFQSRCARSNRAADCASRTPAPGLTRQQQSFSARARRCRVPRVPVFRRGVVCEVFSVT